MQQDRKHIHWGACQDCAPLDDGQVDDFIKRLANIYDMNARPEEREAAREQLRQQIAELNAGKGLREGKA